MTCVDTTALDAVILFFFKAGLRFNLRKNLLKSYPQFLWTSLWINPRIAASNRGNPWIARKSGDECRLAGFLMTAPLVA